MDEILSGDRISAARADFLDRSRRHLHACICLAVVTPQPVAADLIDEAIELHMLREDERLAA